MAKKVASWRDRRWKLFEEKLALDPDFQAVLLEINHLAAKMAENIEDDNAVAEVRDKVMALVEKYKLPTECTHAVVLFVLNPNLQREKYLAAIQPPLKFWNPLVSDKLPPSNNETLGEFYDRIFSKKYPKDQDITLGLYELLTLIASAGTVLQLHPYLTKTDLHELIDEYWDELSELLNADIEFNSRNFNKRMLEKIQAAPTAAEVKRMKIILYYTQEGLNDTEIWWKLHEEGVDIPKEQIKVYRSRLLKKYKVSRGNKSSK